MEFSSQEHRDLLRPYAHGSNVPHRALYTHALTLAAGDEPSATYVERRDAGDESTVVIWALFEGRLVRVRSSGPANWDGSNPRVSEPDATEANSWPLSAVTALSISELVRRDDPHIGGDMEWNAQMIATIDGSGLGIPEFGVPREHSERQRLDQFTRELIKACRSRP